MNDILLYFNTYKGYLIILLIVIFLGLWIGLLFWTIRDIKLRSRSWVFWVFSALLILLLFLPGFLIYLLFRPRKTLDEELLNQLQEESLMHSLIEPVFCPNCKHEINPEWLICPTCHTLLSKPCLKCGKHIDTNWTICPFCGNENIKSFTDVSIKK